MISEKIWRESSIDSEKDRILIFTGCPGTNEENSILYPNSNTQFQWQHRGKECNSIFSSRRLWICRNSDAYCESCGEKFLIMGMEYRCGNLSYLLNQKTSSIGLAASLNQIKEKHKHDKWVEKLICDVSDNKKKKMIVLLTRVKLLS